ncbi:MAG: hypothetical protein PHV34_13320 [Verrucomicrobiae bacterium]|nr:hypothetical protein [Verrucomicrobiae bacterium]
MQPPIQSDQIKSEAVTRGADLAGIASVNRWEHAPIELSPQGIMPNAKSAIVVAVNLTDAGTEFASLVDPQNAGLGEVTGLAWRRLDHITYRLAKCLERAGHQAIPIVCTSLWRYRSYKGIDRDNVFLPDISHIHAGAAAGLGEIGYSGLLITPEYGPRVRLGTVITDAPLTPDPLYDGPPLCDRCKMCVKACRKDCASALCKDVDGECEVKIENKTYRYAKLNKWRCAWGEHFSLDLKEVPIPDNPGTNDVIKAMEKNDVKGWLNGRCQKFCLPPHLRQKSPKPGMPWKKKKTLGLPATETPFRPGVLTNKIKQLALKRGADHLAILSAADFSAAGFDLKRHLPSATGAIVFGMTRIKGEIVQNTTPVAYGKMDYPKTAEMKQGLQDTYLASDIVQQRLVFMGLDITQALEGLGHDALCCVQHLGDYAKAIQGWMGAPSDCRWGLVITNAQLNHDRPQDLPLPHHLSVRLPPPSPGKLAVELKGLALELGADLAGVTSVDRLLELQPQLETILAREKGEYFIVQDVGRLSKGPFEPKVIPKTLRVKSPRDYLPDARSVIVLGMHYPDAVVDRAAKPPAEAVGPYGFAQSETINQLDDIALDLIRRLRERGYDAAYSYDLHGMAGLVTGSCASGRSYYGMPWRGAGLYPDLTANRFAAIAAGLGELGWSGTVLTPEYGNRQRFAAIITNAPLKADPLYQGNPLCKKCHQCVASCPVRALTKEKIQITLEGRTFEYGACERLRCDWSKRYALVGKEGPAFIGSQTNVMPPDNITKEAVCEALKQMDPLQKACMVIVEQCATACMIQNSRFKTQD